MKRFINSTLNTLLLLNNEHKGNFGIRNFNSWKAISAATRISIIWLLIGLLSWHGYRTFQPRIFNPKLQPRNFNPRKQTTTWLKVISWFKILWLKSLELKCWIFLQLHENKLRNLRSDRNLCEKGNKSPKEK